MFTIPSPKQAPSSRNLSKIFKLKRPAILSRNHLWTFSTNLLCLILLTTTVLSGPLAAETATPKALPSNSSTNSLDSLINSARDKVESSKVLSKENPLLALGIIKYENGETRQAIELFRKILEYYNTDEGKTNERPEALIYLGRAFAKENQLTLARNAFTRLINDYKEHELCDDALMEIAHLDGKFILSADDVKKIFNDFVFQDPLTIDFDALVYLPGYSKGYRLDGLDKGLSALRKLWTTYPESGKADDALLQEAYNRGFMLDQRENALTLLNKLIDEYPNSEHLPFAVLAKAFLKAGEQQWKEALSLTAEVEPHSDAAPSASFLAGYISAYQKRDSSRALVYFKAMEQLSDNELWKGAALYHQAMTHFVFTHKFKIAHELAAKAKDLLSPFTGDRALVMMTAAKYISDTASLINEDKDIYQARLKYALFYQGGGHPKYAADEFQNLLTENLPEQLRARVEYELGIIMHDDLNSPDEGTTFLRAALARNKLSSNRHEEAKYRIARSEAATENILLPLKDIAEGKSPWAKAAAKELTRNSAFSTEAYSEFMAHSNNTSNTPNTFKAPVLKNLAEMFEREGNLKQALEYYGRLLTIWPEAAEAMTETEERLALVRLMNSINMKGATTPDDAPLLLAIGLIQEKLDMPKEARMYLRRAKKASKGSDNETPISFELMQFEVKNSRSPQHGLTIVNSFLKNYPGKTKEALEALSIKASLLEDRLPTLTNDKKEEERIRTEANDIRRYLIKRGTNVAESVLILANRYYSDNEYLRALEVLERANSLRPVPAEILNLKAQVFLELKEYEQRKDTLYTLSTAYRTTEDGKKAAEFLKKDREATLEQTVVNIHSIPVIYHRLAFYLAEADDDELKSTKLLLEQLNRTLQEKEKMTPQLRLLIGKGLIRGENFAGGAKLVVMALKEMSESKTPPSNNEAIKLKLMAADAHERGNNKAAAWELLETISKDSDEAVLKMARLQVTAYKDEEQAEPLFEQLIKSNNTSFNVLTESYLSLAEIKYKGTKNTDRYIDYLKTAEKRIPAKFTYELSQKLGEKQNSKLRFGQSVQWWLKAAKNAPSAEQMAQCSLEAVKAMLASKQWQRARQKLNQLLSGGIPPSHQKEMQQLLKETSAKEQLSSLRKALNWDDPENRSNFVNLKKMARLYISPLGEMEKAQAIITQATQIFPNGTKNAEVKDILRTIPIMIKINNLEQKASTPEDYYHLARICEDESGDSEKACEFYKIVTEKWPEHKYTPLALMYLVRLEGLVLNQSQNALEHLQQLLDKDISKRLSPRLTAFVSLKASSEKLSLLYKKAEKNIASGRELMELGKIAATELSDPKSVKLALNKLKAINGYKNEAYKLAILASSSLEPQALITPGGATPEYFLNEAIDLADSKDKLSKAHLLMGIHKIESRQLMIAINHFNLAIEASPGSNVAEDALFRTAEILETMLNEEERALTIYSDIANSGKNSQNIQIASTRSERLTEKLAVDGLIDETHKEAVSKKSAVLYFYTGRQLQRDTKSLEQALTAFRTYIRLGEKPPLLIKAYKSASETLVRLERPAEAIEELEKLISSFPEMIDKEETLLAIAKIREVNLADYDGALDIYKRVARSSSPRKVEGEEGALRMAKLRKELLRSQEVGLSAEAASDEVKNIRNEFLQGKRKNWSGAAEALKEQIEDAESQYATLPLLLELGSIQDKNLKEYENAVETYDAFLSISKDKRRNGNVMLRKGDIQISELKQPEEALETYEKWLKTFFGHGRRVEVMLKVAELKETQLDRTQEALEEYIIIAASYPRSGYDEKALMRLANLQQTYYADFQAAITAYTQITERFPFGNWADDAQFYIGRLYEIELGNLVTAKEEYQKVIDLYPSSPFTAQARDALIRIERKNE